LTISARYVIITIEREVKRMKKMTTYFYRFADGYTCWYACKLRGTERKNEMRAHGAIIEERAC
jgi:hypothetical protein